MSALILDGHADAAIPFIQELGKSGVLVDVAAKENCLAFTSVFARKCFVYPEQKAGQQFLDWIKSLDEHGNYEFIVPTTEKMLHQFQQLDEDDPMREKAVLACKKSIDIALNKVESIRLASSLNIPVPQSLLFSDNPEPKSPFGYPVVLKTLNSQVLKDEKMVYAPVCIARDEGQYHTFLEKWSGSTDLQIQEYFPGHGWGIEVLYEYGRKRWHFAHERIHELPLTGGASTYRRSVAAPKKMLGFATVLLDRLKWHGIAMVEFKVNRKGEFVFLEINPRPWGSMSLSVKSGVNFPLGLYALSRHMSVEDSTAYRTNFYARHVVKDIVWFKENMKADHADEFLLTRNSFMSFIELFRVLMGKESWDHFSWQDLSVVKNQLYSLVRQLFQKVKSIAGAIYQSWKIRLMHTRNLKLISLSKVGVESVVFVCYGNICRSPFAEHVAKNLTNTIRFESSGFHGNQNRRSPDMIVKLADGFGVDLRGHRSRSLNLKQVEAARVVVVMDQSNFVDFCSKFPSATKKVLLLGLFLDDKELDIPDPYTLNSIDAKKSLNMVRGGVDKLVKIYSGNQ